MLGACLDQLDPLPAGANLGVVYCSEALAPVADELVRALRARTGVLSWLGACGSAVLGAGRRARASRFWSWRCPAGGFRVQCRDSPMAASVGVLLAHAELADRADPARCWPSSRPQAPRTRRRRADRGRPLADPDRRRGHRRRCGLPRLRAGQPVVAGIATAGSPLGATHRVTSAVNGEILALDGRPALAVMTEELGDLFRHSGPAVRARALGGRARARRVAGGVHAHAADRRGRRRPRLAAGGGRPARRRAAADAAGPRRLAGARARSRPGPCSPGWAARVPMAGIYLASRHRGHGLFGPGVDEIAILREELGRCR